ncbi:MAG: universal stress protein [Chloroflexi bacterium]|nr:universal stress protein [Chloroflexota bacterium]
MAEALAGHYDLLIIGERPQHNLISRILGPTALRIIAHQPCPVLIAKEEPHSLDQILVCDSIFASPNLAERLSQQLRICWLMRPLSTVLHVMSQIAAAPGIPGQQAASRR